MISPSCIFLSSFVSTCRFVCIVPSEVIAQLAVSRPKFLFKSHPGVPTCIKIEIDRPIRSSYRNYI